MKKKLIFLSIAFLVFAHSPVFADKPDKAQCPQKRNTPTAPAKYLELKNPSRSNC